MNITIGGQAVTIDPDRLTPTARQLAEAVADTPGRDTVDIWLESDQPIRDTTPDWETWYGPDGGDRLDKRPWRGWNTQPLASGDPHDRLEHEATKIPPGWHVYGAHPDRPLPDVGPIRELTVKHVLAYLAENGRKITPATWRSYVGRGQAPAPSKWVGRTPVWLLEDIEKWVNAPERRK